MPSRIPRSFVDELVQRVNIVDIINSRVPLTAAGRGEYKARCPFHEEKTPSFTVSQAKQFYYCFGCGASGTAIGFLMAHAHLGFVEAVENLAAQAGLRVPRDGGASHPQERATSDVLTVLASVSAWYAQQLQGEGGDEARAYLQARGISKQTATDFAIGYAPPGWDNVLRAFGTTPAQCKLLLQAGLVKEKERRTADGRGHRAENARVPMYDRFRSRLMLPVEDERGRVVAFGARTLGDSDSEPKYLNSTENPLFLKGSKLYNLHKARAAIKKDGRCLVVEGYMDVILLAEHGIANAVATLGSATTAHHLARMFGLGAHVIFCFDGDEAGRRAAWKALCITLPQLSDGRRASFLFLPEGHDPDSLVRAEGAVRMRERMQEALPLPDFLLQKLRTEVDMKRLDGAARLTALAKPLLQAMPRGVLRQSLSTRLASLARLPPETMARELALDHANDGGAISTMAHRARVQRPLSVVARALSMLLQQPTLATEIPHDADWQSLAGLPGATLLGALTEALHAEPHISTAALVERYRDTAHFAHLEKLAVRGHVTDAQTPAEFRSVVEKLLHEWPREQEIEGLLQKNREGGLDATGKARLNFLLGHGGKTCKNSKESFSDRV